jgi:hypothetical protein
MSLAQHVTNLEEQLAKLDYQQSTGFAIQSASNQLFVFASRFLKDQGFNVITIDFGELFYTRDKSGEEFVQEKIDKAIEKALAFEKPIIHLMKFASYDAAYSKNVHAIIEKGIDISFNEHLEAKKHNEIILNSNTDTHSNNTNNNNNITNTNISNEKKYFVPFAISSNTLLGHETTRLCQTCYEIPSRDLRSSTWVSRSSVAFEEKLYDHYNRIEKDSLARLREKQAEKIAQEEALYIKEAALKKMNMG